MNCPLFEKDTPEHCRRYPDKCDNTVFVHGCLVKGAECECDVRQDAKESPDTATNSESAT